MQQLARKTEVSTDGLQVHRKKKFDVSKMPETHALEREGRYPSVILSARVLRNMAKKITIFNLQLGCSSRLGMTNEA